ncbi:MAG TPA: LysM peptidoglycan-binding domain-containing protein [Opitutus sp.]|nr:LysM peptidoglycan-binding domain-containing protein [Opitutus sp.]
MKILRIFGVVVGVHVFALMLIFVNPGCSSANKPPPPAADTVVNESGDTAVLSPAPTAGQGVQAPTDADASGAPVVRFSPTRPGTPAAGAIEAAPVSDVVPASTYTVASGDSLWTIARKHHLSVAELAAANNIRASAVVRIGQKLIIPSKAVSGSSVSVVDPGATKAAPTPPAARGTRESVRHVVRPGETLGAIARKYQVRVGEIATANNIADPAKIRPGMELTIPGWQAPAARTTNAAAPANNTAPAESEPAPAAPAGEIPTLVIPPPEDAGAATPSAGEPPVIRVEEQP